MSMSYKRHYFDSHEERKIHKGNVPRLGGIIFFPVATIMLLLSTIVAMNLIDYNGLPVDLKQILGLIGAMFIMFLFGIVDDLKGMLYRTKFISQIAAGLLLCVSGVWLQDLHGLFWLEHLSPWFGWPLTVFAIIFVINAINFIDGIDGLAGSLSLIALSYYAYFNYQIGNRLTFLLAIILIGCLLPYLYYNLFGTSKGENKIFMGDTGSTILGVVLVSMGMMVSNSPKMAECDFNPMMVGFAPLVYPCYDTVRVVLHRLKRGNSPFMADTNHFHHKLLHLGMSQRKALFTIIGLSITLIIIMVLSSGVIGINWVLVLSLVLWTLLNILLTKKIKTKTTIKQDDEN